MVVLGYGVAVGWPVVAGQRRRVVVPMVAEVAVVTRVRARLHTRGEEDASVQ